MNAAPNSGPVKPALQIKIKSVYGNTLIYPANEAAELIAKIAGTKTINGMQLVYAEQLGFQIQEVPAYQYTPQPQGAAA